MKRLLSIVLGMLIIFSVIPFTANASTDDVIEIYTIEDLYNINNNMSGNYKLMNDIDMTEATAKGGSWDFMGNGWEPIGSDGIYTNTAFTGTFDGNNHKIIGMRISISKIPSGSNAQYIGLFTNNAGTIKNLGIDENSIVKNGDYAGGICAYNSGIISNCYNKSNISSTGYSGGICGIMKSGNINDCYNSGSISSTRYSGGICASSSDVNITNCYNTGIISTSSDYSLLYSGGICSYSYNCIFTNCYNTATISTCISNASTAPDGSFSTYSGGICGYSTCDNIINCFNNNKILTSTNISTVESSGLMYYKNIASVARTFYGVTFQPNEICGVPGAINASNMIKVSDATAFSYLYDIHSYSGGVCGYSSRGTVTNCYNTSNISSSVSTPYSSSGATSGGITGKSTSSITNCYNTGKANYGICGNSSGKITNCYYLSTAGSSNTGAKALTETQLQLEMCFENFDFKNTWIIDKYTSYKYPQLISNRQDLGNAVDTIEILSYPTKISYYTGETVDITGGAITAYYADGTWEDIMLTDEMVSQDTFSTVGLQEVTINFRGVTTSFFVNVTEYVPVNIVSLTLNSEPNKKEFIKNTEFDFTGCQATAVYDNGTTEVINITPDMTTGGDISTVGEQTITYTHDGLQVEFTVTVLALKVTDIEIVSLPEKLTYIEKQDFISEGLTVKAYYNSGEIREITNYTLSGYSSDVGIHTITVSYLTFSETFDVEVKEKSPISIVVTSAPKKTEYIQGEKFNKDGMIVTATFDNGDVEEVTDYTVDDFSDTVGYQTVAVSYKGVQTYVAVYVIEKSLASIKVTNKPNKTVYVQGEEFDPTGLIISAEYIDGDIIEVTDYTLSGCSTNAIGDKMVTVSYCGKTTAFVISVVEKTLQKIEVELPNKTDYIIGDEFDSTGMIVTAFYDNGKSEEITDYTITGYTGESGTNTITVTYENKSYSFLVTIHTPADEWVITKTPTCTEKGEKTLYCKDCSKIIKIEDVTATGHTEVVIKGYDFTCLKDGLTDGKYCSVCDEILQTQDVILAQGHSATKWTIVTESTCTENGVQVKYCDKCGEAVETSDINSPGHTVVVDEAIPPTCINSGLTEGSHCSACGLILSSQQVIEPTGHNWDNGYISESPTCTTTGEKIYTCKNCGITKTESLNLLGHNFNEDFTIDKEATCTEDGSKSRHCIRCKTTTDVTVISKLGHNFGEYISNSDATCTTDGTKTAKCERCNKTHTVTNTDSAKGHISSDWIIIKEATCTEDGEKVKSCSECNIVLETQVISAKGHTVVIDEAILPTCTKTGVTEGKHCSVCNEILVAQDVINSLGHSYSNEWAIDKKATCTKNGSKSHHCLKCDIKADITVIEATGHTYGKWIIDREATCSVTGKRHKTCEVCNETITENISLLNHVSSDWVVDKEATCTSKGTQHKECAECHKTLETESIPATGHTEEIDEALAPTCTETGLTEGSHCSVCEKVIISQQLIEATGHSTIITKNGVLATCTQSGLTDELTCKHCKSIVKAQTIISALGHKEVVDKSINPTCTKTGLTEGKHCSVCDEILIAQQEINATGHTVVIDESISPTCTKTGLTEGKHCSVCDNILIVQQIINATGHTVVTDKAISPTCTESGLTEGSHCLTCNTILTEQDKVNPLGHTKVTDQAISPTCTDTGLTEGCHCSKCGEVLTKQETVSVLGHNEITVNKKSATYFAKGYTGDTVCGSCNEIISKGKATAKLKLKTPTVKITGGKKKITVKYTKVKGATGFQVKYKIGKKTITKTYKTKKTATKAISKLKKGTYKVYVRAFVKSGSKTAYSSWTKAKKVKIK